jgi:cellulose synthase/poly-beta-1,6-N-acetylglucosamine synthase-like glycosyltransferase/uncharacterized protein YegP (UPF0339 family)
MKRSRAVASLKFVGLVALLALAFAGLFFVLPADVVLVFAAFAAMAAVYFGTAVLLAHYNDYTPNWISATPAWLVVLFPVLVAVVYMMHFWAEASVVLIAFVLALMVLFAYYWLVVPLALVQKLEQQGWRGTVEEWPDVSVLIPAFRERGAITRLLDSLAAASYPADVEIVVVDDGSLDGTYEEALAHPTTDATVIQKENAGKHSALNRGIEIASHDVLVSIDADSWIAPDALTKLIQEFERNPGAGAIAGNVKVGNRGRFVTKLQALEYVVGINTFRRAFDHVGLVSVVPGCLGAFRKEVLEEVEGYSDDTLTEDFDLTIEILKRGHSVHASEGVVYTEAPDTWRGLYRQRKRWYRGNVQTLWKHASIFVDRSYGQLHRVVFPYAFLSMTLLPVFSLFALAVVPAAVLLGETTLFVQTAVFFLLLVVLLSVLAIEIDDEDRWLAALAPFSIVGYKQFLDVVLIRSIVDVFSGRRLPWTSAENDRAGGSGPLVYDPPSPVDDIEPVARIPATANDSTTFDVYRDAEDGWRWRLRHRTGETFAVSGEAYSDRDDAEAAARRVSDLAADADVLEYDPAGFEVYRLDDEWRWQLRTSHGRLLARSHEGYASRGNARAAVDRIRALADDAERWSVTVGEQGGYHWRLTAPDGTVLARNAHRCAREGNTKRAIEHVRAVIPEADDIAYDPAGFEFYVDSTGTWRWRLQALDGRVFSESGSGYASRSEVRAAVEHTSGRVGDAAVARR